MTDGGGRKTAGRIELSFVSELAAPLSSVWSEATTFAGINAELTPWVKMTFPRALRSEGYDRFSRIVDIVAADRSRSAEVTDRRVVRSWLLVFGFVPFDRHAFRVERIIARAGVHGFDEDSTSWLQRRWRHERRVTSIDSTSCRLTDELTVVPRLALFRRPTAFFAGAVFGHRHRRLARRFGARLQTPE